MRMNQFKSGLSLVVLGLALAPMGAYADSWNCTHNNIQREVKVVYTGAGPVPCQVVYNKPDEGGASQVLWNAESEQGFCEERAQTFVAKLESWGWACTNVDAKVSDTPSAPSDTDAPMMEMEQTAPGEQVQQGE